MLAALVLSVCCCHVPSDFQPTTATVEPQGWRCKVGEIIVIGNYDTPQRVILNQVPFVPGERVTSRQLRQAEVNLVRLGLFRIDPRKGIRPTVEIIEPDGPDKFKSILVTIEERPSNRFRYALIDLALLPVTGEVGWCLRRTLEDPARTFRFMWSSDE